MKQITLFLFAFVPTALSWTPISNPLKGFSLSQTLPAFGASASSPGIDQHAAQSIRPAQARQVTTSTFFGKKVLNVEDNASHYGSSFEGSSSLGDDELIRPHGFFEQKIHNGFLANVSQIK